LATSAAGCQSPSQYVSPRVTGRVLDSETHQPVPDVQVRRTSDQPRPHAMEPPKGAQMLQLPPGVRTGADGTFTVASQSDLAFFRRLGWYSLTLTFTHPGYEKLTQTYGVAGSTKSASGEPWVQAGDVLLQAVRK